MQIPVSMELRRRLSSGPPAFAGWMSINESYVAEILLAEAFDALIVDMQHGGVDVAVAMRTLGVAGAARKPVLVRVPIDDFACGAKLLDWGASGIIAPMINSVGDAQRLISFCKYPPLGSRSWGPQRAITGLSAKPSRYLEAGNGGPLLIAMIETRQALDAASAILDLDGIDGLFVGPADLSLSLSDGQRLDPLDSDVRSEIERLAGLANAHGKPLLAFAATGRAAADFVSVGCSLVAVSTDAAMLRLASRSELKAIHAQ